MKTIELTGTALDWAVELAKGTSWSDKGYFVFKNPDGTTRAVSSRPEWCYSTAWSQGGPIIDMELIKLAAPNWKGGNWAARIREECDDETASGYLVWHCGSGPTALIAAMRCFVAFKLGGEVEIPQEILT